ncbi:sensor domain-containing diguanylate cyclase [Hydrogenophaga defluvii]|uniref:diguanylate cyclase n=1 Tax=Hydrogenophaga defluvii TaxID=249410 RepID=A0ABW2S9U2_9BURK
MLYTESKEKSAELLRAVLALMNQHSAAFNPVTYAVCYEYVAGINGRLNQAFDHFTRTEARLSDNTMVRLYREHIAGIDDKTMERISGDMQRVMTGMSESAARTGNEAGDFTQHLAGLSQALQSSGTERLGLHLGQALQQTEAMRSSAAALQAQVAASQREIEQLRTDLQRAREDVFMDALTRVLNRKGLDHKMGQLLRTPPNAGTQHALVMLDIDHFKAINDGHGHLMGDRVLSALGELLRLSVGEAGSTVARYGGEEFAILLPHATPALAKEVAERVRLRTKALKIRHKQTNEVVLTLTLSAGVATQQHGEDATAWIARADKALYQAKESGRDRVSLAA